MNDRPGPSPQPDPERPAAPGDEGDLERLALRLAGVLRRHYRRSAAAHDLTPPQATALRHLGDAAPMRELAERMGCDASYVTALADALEERGLAERRPDPADRRVRQLALTPAGRATADAFMRTLIGGSPLARALDPAERARFGALLERVLAAHTASEARGCPPHPCDAS